MPPDTHFLHGALSSLLLSPLLSPPLSLLSSPLLISLLSPLDHLLPPFPLIFPPPLFSSPQLSRLFLLALCSLALLHFVVWPWCLALCLSLRLSPHLMSLPDGGAASWRSYLTGGAAYWRRPSSTFLQHYICLLYICFNSFLACNNIYCTSVRPGGGIPPLLLTLSFLMFFPVKRLFYPAFPQSM